MIMILCYNFQGKSVDKIPDKLHDEVRHRTCRSGMSNNNDIRARDIFFLGFVDQL